MVTAPISVRFSTYKEHTVRQIRSCVRDALRWLGPHVNFNIKRVDLDEQENVIGIEVAATQIKITDNAELKLSI